MEEKIYTVTELTKIVKITLENEPELNSVWLKGEISNLTYHSSGHIYFSLKDNDSVISAAFFRYANRALNFKLEEGMSILAFGSINIFEKRGTYQFIVAQARLEGIGELLKRIEQLKKKLLEEGIFEQSRKKQLPRLPRRVGIVTSPTGAAFRDIVKVALRRFPNIELLLAPAKVQGAGAPESIVRAIQELNNPEHEIDVIIAGRGGGSFEDLMAFNEEIVVRAYADSRVPIISAVGHQIDHPLSDDAADTAAPTPSAAAEIALPVKDELIDYIDRLHTGTLASVTYMIRDRLSAVKGIDDLRVFRNPMEIVLNKELMLADTENRVVSSMKEITAEYRNTFLSLADTGLIMKNILRERSHRLDLAWNSVINLSPAGILRKGYTITTDARGNVIGTVDKLNKGDNVNLLFTDGTASGTVNSINKEERFGRKK